MVLFGFTGNIILVVIIYVLAGLKVINEYERGVIFFLGKHIGMYGSGLKIVLPILMTWERIDLRTKTVDVPEQDCITKDNVSIKANAVLFYMVSDANLAIIKVENFDYAVSQIAQTTMRDVIGEIELDDLLGKRDTVSKRIREIVDKATDPWGIKVEGVELKHVELPETLKRVISQEAEAEREKRAVIIKAEGEVIASKNMAKAAETLAKAPGALHLRTLQTINDISSDASNKIIVGIPMEMLRAFEGMKKK